MSDKVGSLFDDPERKLRKYLQGGKIEQAGEWNFEYDKDGQLTEKYKGSGKWWDTKRERWQYEWNQNGTLKAVKSPHRTNRVEFTYDALGRRLSKLASEYTHWVWNGNVPLHEWNSGREWKDNGWQHYELDLRTWVFEEESFVPMALLLNGKVYSIVTDQLGTPTEAYNAEGEEVWRRRLDMNGKILEEVYDQYAPYSERVRIPFLFQGQYCDHETGLAYNRFRYYDPEFGRYISEDSIRFNSRVYSFYVYVANPNLVIDVLGLDWNYVLVNADGKAYYHGRASDSQTLEDVARRHASTEGTDGARFEKGDTLQRKTAVGSPKDTVRGIEQRGIEENSLLGRGRSEVRGNKINGISEAKQKTKTGQRRLKAADALLKSKGVGKVSDLPTLEEIKFNDKGYKKQ